MSVARDQLEGQIKILAGFLSVVCRCPQEELHQNYVPKELRGKCSQCEQSHEQQTQCWINLSVAAFMQMRKEGKI